MPVKRQDMEVVSGDIITPPSPDCDDILSVQKHFVEVVRATESALGIGSDDLQISISATLNFSASIGSSKKVDDEVDAALQDALPIIMRIADEFGLSTDDASGDPLVTE
jgi:hypothetical protein